MRNLEPALAALLLFTVTPGPARPCVKMPPTTFRARPQAPACHRPNAASPLQGASEAALAVVLPRRPGADVRTRGRLATVEVVQNIRGELAGRVEVESPWEGELVEAGTLILLLADDRGVRLSLRRCGMVPVKDVTRDTWEALEPMGVDLAARYDAWAWTALATEPVAVARAAVNEVFAAGAFTPELRGAWLRRLLDDAAARVASGGYREARHLWREVLGLRPDHAGARAAEHELSVRAEVLFRESLPLLETAPHLARLGLEEVAAMLPVDAPLHQRALHALEPEFTASADQNGPLGPQQASGRALTRRP